MLNNIREIAILLKLYAASRIPASVNCSVGLFLKMSELMVPFTELLRKGYTCYTVVWLPT